MNPVFGARRRADEFSSMVEGSSTDQLHDAGRYDAELAPLVGLVTSLRSTPAPEARPEFVSDLRSRLMLAAETTLAPDTAAQSESRRAAAPRRTARERRLAVAVGGFALVSASASMSFAAQSALPGDTLYPLKRALENVHESVLRDPDSRGATILGNASSRLDEVDQLTRTGEQDPAVISRTLEDFTTQAVEASGLLLGDYEQTGQESSIQELQTFTSESLDALQRLQGIVPVEARGSLVAATRVLDRISAQVERLCPACADVLPRLDDALSAADLGPLYDKIITSAPKPVPSAGAQPGESRQAPRKPTATADPAPVTQQTGEPEVEEPEQPGLPTGPGGTGPGNPNGGNDPLGEVVTGLGDPLGDLLTGVGELAEDLLGGGTGGTGGTGKGGK
jgi:hypothetical protein